MRRVVTAVVAAGALVALAAAPAGAQEIPDVPELGFEIDPLEGPVGSTVNGFVDTDDVAEHCITDPEAFVSQFINLENLFDEEHPYIAAVIAWAEETFGEDFVIENPDTDPVEFMLLVSVFAPLGLALDVLDPEGGELVEGALAQTFIMAFADLETASPIPPFGNFDRHTGEGSVEVPDIAPGFHPVIATCIGVPEELTFDDIDRAIAAGVAFIEANFETPYPDDFLSDEFAEAAGQVFPAYLEELVQPRALGFEFFCVFDETGVCPTDEEPPVDDDEVPIAEAVVIQPVFTG
jgi:hypothetical protein